MITVDMVEIAKNKIKFGRVRLDVRVPSSHNFSNLGGQLKTRYNDTFGENWKGDLYHNHVNKVKWMKREASICIAKS